MKIIKRILISIMVIFLLAGVGVSAYMLNMAPLNRLNAAFESYLGGSNAFLDFFALEYDVERDLSTLPAILNEDDMTINDFENRKAEIITLFEDNIYGSYPKDDYDVSFIVLEEDDMALDGTAIRKQIEITISTTNGSSKALMLLYLPKTDEAVPVFFGLNFLGNQVTTEEDVLMSFYNVSIDKNHDGTEGERYERWPAKEIIARGYGIATIHADDFAPDDKKAYDSRLISIFDDNDDFMAVSAWAFGISRGIDYLIQDDLVNQDQIYVVGHSRMGKATLWASALDERIALTISNGSGCTGAAISRDIRGENIKIINHTFPYWFIDAYEQYDNNEDALPVDQHMLLAIIAPRNLYIASSDRDLWADPNSEYLSLAYATEAYALYGATKLAPTLAPDAPYYLHTEFYGYHIKESDHQLNLIDWGYFLDYVDNYMN